MVDVEGVLFDVGPIIYTDTRTPVLIYLDFVFCNGSRWILTAQIISTRKPHYVQSWFAVLFNPPAFQRNETSCHSQFMIHKEMRGASAFIVLLA